MRLLPSGELSGVSAAEQGPTARSPFCPIKREFGLEYLGVGVRLHTLADGRGRNVTHAQPPVAKLGAGRSASARAEFMRLTRETVGAWCAQTMSFARFCRSAAKSQ